MNCSSINVAVFIIYMLNGQNNVHFKQEIFFTIRPPNVAKQKEYMKKKDNQLGSWKTMSQGKILNRIKAENVPIYL